MKYIPEQILVMAIAGFSTILFGTFIIPFLKKLKAKQEIREDGPESHLSKAGTPTMGGLVFICGIIFTSLILVGRESIELLIMIGIMLAFGFVGFLDDSLKVFFKRNLGLRAYQKIILQLAFSAIAGYAALEFSPSGSEIWIPIIKRTFDLGIFYIPFIMFFIIALVNGVNLTDGLDGLASSVTAVVAFFLMIISFKYGGEAVTVFSAAIAGSCLGFLKYNKYPARIFMGDTGAMALGGAIAGVAIFSNVFFIIPIVGGIYVAELLSVIIQVASFKLRGKRVFKMAPLHHHYELKGLNEQKVVFNFVLTSVGLGVIGLLIMYI